MRSPTIQSLQAGRGIAAVAVLIHHAALAARDFGGTRLIILEQGYLGVDFFFVLSGFIIYHSTIGRNRSVAQYASARFRRVYLPYWPVGIAVALLYVAIPHLSAGDRTWSWLATFTLAPIDMHPALNVAWTLQHEILFYSMFGLFYFSGLLWPGLAVWALCIVGIGHHLPFEPINLEFLFGIGAAILYRSARAHPALVLLGVIVLCLWAYVGADEAHRVLFGLALALVIAPVAQLEQKRHFAVPAWVVGLGAASYSIYLVHVPLISLAARFVHGGWAILILSAVAGLAGGYAYHFIVEVRAVRPKANPEVFGPA